MLTRRTGVVAWAAVQLLLASSSVDGFVRSPRSPHRGSVTSVVPAATPTGVRATTAFKAVPAPEAGSDEWELDCYSRPVVDDKGKKLWELLICDSNGSFRHVESIPANKVNSREVRSRVERVVEQADVRPKCIKFFRKEMSNMLTIALNDIGTGIAIQPSRTTYALYKWIEQRNQDVYPTMNGFKASMRGSGSAFFDIATSERMPDALRADQFAFVSLPLSDVLEGAVNKDNIGVGKLCPIPDNLPDKDIMLQGVLLLTKRASSLAYLVSGAELAFMKADLKRREMVMEVGLDTRYLMARLNDVQRVEGQAFEEGKAALNGLHFVGVQTDAESDEVAGFWLLRETANLKL